MPEEDDMPPVDKLSADKPGVSVPPSASAVGDETRNGHRKQAAHTDKGKKERYLG